MSPMYRARPLSPFALLLVAGLGLSACAQAPRLITGPAPAPAAIAPPDAFPAPAPTDVSTASRAERACVDQGNAQGLSVQGVVGTRAVTDSGGATTGRDVMLRVSRQGQMFEVRCNYVEGTDTARIMSL